MANIDAPNGFRPVKHRSGMPWNGSATRYVIPATDATASFVGDAVKLAGTSDSSGKVPGCIQAATGDRVVGVIAAMEPDFDNLTLLYRTASTERFVYVIDDPSVLFEIQDDGVGATLAATDIGLNANFIVGSGNTTTGASGMELDTNTKATTNTLDLKIHSITHTPRNELAANVQVLVSFNKHQFADQVAGV